MFLKMEHEKNVFHKNLCFKIFHLKFVENAIFHSKIKN